MGKNAQIRRKVFTFGNFGWVQWRRRNTSARCRIKFRRYFASNGKLLYKREFGIHKSSYGLIKRLWRGRSTQLLFFQVESLDQGRMVPRDLPVFCFSNYIFANLGQEVPNFKSR